MNVPSNSLFALPAIPRKRGTTSLVRNVVQNKLRERKLMMGEDDGIQEYSREESDYDENNYMNHSRDNEIGNF